MTFEVEVPRRPAASLAPVIGSERRSCLTKAAEWGRDHVGKHTIWNVNSTSAGGGVADREVRRLLDSPERAEQLGLAAQAHVRQHYVGDMRVVRYVQLLAAALGAPRTTGRPQHRPPTDSPHNREGG